MQTREDSGEREAVNELKGRKVEWLFKCKLDNEMLKTCYCNDFFLISQLLKLLKLRIKKAFNWIDLNDCVFYIVAHCPCCSHNGQTIVGIWNADSVVRESLMYSVQMNYLSLKQGKQWSFQAVPSSPTELNHTFNIALMVPFCQERRNSQAFSALPF